MSQYCTLAQFQTLGITPAARVRFSDDSCTAQLIAASGIADSYLASQFTLPIVTYDTSLTLAVANIAAYNLYCQYGFNPANSPADQLIQIKYENAIKWLSQIRDEELFPQWTDSSSTVPAAGPYIESQPQIGFNPPVGPNVSAQWSFPNWCDD
jgi:phage gp36-like protein